ncbi:MAG: hypothetical protein WD356_06195 [Pseudomonadales bacterium]
MGLVVGCTLTGCTTNVTVEGGVPTPVVAKMPLHVGVYFSDEFKTFQHEEVIEQAGTWKVNLGAQNVAFFRNLFDAMFESVSETGEPPLAESEAERFDGIIVPRVAKYGFLTPQISGLNFYSASIEYEIVLYDSAGERLGSWNVVGYGKSEPGVFGHGDALGEATMLAIRDGGARIATNLADQPEITQWLASRQSGHTEE